MSLDNDMRHKFRHECNERDRNNGPWKFIRYIAVKMHTLLADGVCVRCVISIYSYSIL